MKSISVIILNWNGAKMLQQFLPSVVQYSVPFAISDELFAVDVVVADNGSTDDSLLVLQQFPTVKSIILDRNYGFAEGYNRAIEQTTTDYTVLLNSDVEVTENWLIKPIEYMEANRDIAAVQPKILAYSTLNDEIHRFEHAGAAGGRIDILGYPFCRGRILGTVEEDRGQYDTIENIFWASGACMFVRTQDYKDIGGLDAYFFAHMEEIDMCWRLQCRGKRIVCVSESQVFHVGGGSLSYESPRKTYLNFRNNLLMLYKNLPLKRLLWVMPCRWVLDYVAALQLLLTGQKANAKAAVEARRDYQKAKHEYRHIRKALQQTATVSLPTTISHRSIVFDYYIRGVRM